MLQAFIITAREGLESFLIVAVIFAYLRKTGRLSLLPVVYAGIATSLLLSIGLGFLLAEVANQALWEGILALVAAVMVGTLVIHMWRMGPEMKRQMEQKLTQISSQSSSKSIAFGVFLFTVLLITREGMETALMLYQVKNGNFILGGLMGIVAAVVISLLWTRFSRFINLKRFFQVTGVFLLIFLVQTLMYAFHELCEAGIFANSDHWHQLTEPYSPDGMYGKWFSFVTVVVIGGWLVAAAIAEKFKRTNKPKQFVMGEVK